MKNLTAAPTVDRGDWFLTSTGIQFYPMDPRSADIRLSDIAHALAQICRFGGHTQFFYSVAQHSVLVSEIVPKEHALVALLHDATEAYVGDMVRPLKRNLPQYKAIEYRVWIAICHRFEIDPAMPECIKAADNRALMTERRDLLIKSDHSWSLEEQFPPIETKITPLEPLHAEAAFITRFRQLYTP